MMPRLACASTGFKKKIVKKDDAFKEITQNARFFVVDLSNWFEQVEEPQTPAAIQ